MDFLDVVKQARAALQSEGRITYRTLKRQFALDDEALEDLKDELLFADAQITEIDGRGLVWNAEAEEISSRTDTTPQQHPQATAVRVFESRDFLRERRFSQEKSL